MVLHLLVIMRPWTLFVQLELNFFFCHTFQFFILVSFLLATRLRYSICICQLLFGSLNYSVACICFLAQEQLFAYAILCFVFFLPWYGSRYHVIMIVSSGCTNVRWFAATDCKNYKMKKGWVPFFEQHCISHKCQCITRWDKRDG